MTAVLDKPADLADLDFNTPCSMHERVFNLKPCGRPATLTVRLHTCDATVSCQQCWRKLITSLLTEAGKCYQCLLCKKKSTNVDDLVWSAPL